MIKNFKCLIKHDWHILDKKYEWQVIQHIEEDLLKNHNYKNNGSHTIYYVKKVCMRCKKVEDSISDYIKWYTQLKVDNNKKDKVAEKIINENRQTHAKRQK